MTKSPRLRDCGNHFLDRLSAGEFDPLASQLQTVNVSIKRIVQSYQVEVDHIYFPTTALISLLTVLEEDDPVEALTVGREGFVGVAAALGVDPSPHRALCQMAGESLRLPIQAMREAMARGPVLPRLVHRYAAFALHSASQGIACNTLHSVEARACRWLLRLHDQARRDVFPMTHEFLASMLAVRRQGVTVVAGVLQSAGLIDYHRGVITIRDRPRLEDAACECYASMSNYYGISLDGSNRH